MFIYYFYYRFGFLYDFYRPVYISRIYSEWIVCNQETIKSIMSKKILTCFLKEIIITFLHLQQVYVLPERRKNIRKYEKFLGQYFIAWNLHMEE